MALNLTYRNERGEGAWREIPTSSTALHQPPLFNIPRRTAFVGLHKASAVQETPSLVHMVELTERISSLPHHIKAPSNPPFLPFLPSTLPLPGGRKQYRDLRGNQLLIDGAVNFVPPYPAATVVALL